MARRRAGFRSAAAFARAYELSEVTYRSHENGQRGMNLEAAQRYARLLKVSPSWLLTGEGGGPDPRTASVTISEIVDSAMGGWVRPLAEEAQYTITFRLPKGQPKQAFAGLVMEGGHHAEFPEGSELIFAAVEKGMPLHSGQYVLLEEAGNGEATRYFGRLETGPRHASVSFTGRDAKHHNQILYWQSQDSGQALAETVHAAFTHANDDREPEVPLENGALRIAGVLIKSIKNE